MPRQSLGKKNLVQSLAAKGLKAIVCRFGTIFGPSPGMRFHTAVNKFCWQAVMGQPLSVWRTAYEQKRPYLDLADAVRALAFIIERDLFDGRIYNVLTLNATVRDIVEAIKGFVPEYEGRLRRQPDHEPVVLRSVGAALSRHRVRLCRRPEARHRRYDVAAKGGGRTRLAYAAASRHWRRRLHRRQFRALLARQRPADRVVVLDALTYAGNPANLASLRARLTNYHFVHGDICDGDLLEASVPATMPSIPSCISRRKAMSTARSSRRSHSSGPMCSARRRCSTRR